MKDQEMKDQDSVFFKNFSMLLGFLVLLTIVLAFTGYYMHEDILGDNEMSTDRSAIAKTIESAAKVNTGEVMEATVEEVEAPAVAFEGSTDGKMIYDNVCFACHGTGAAGAPKLEAAAWDGRLALGLDGLTASVIKGKGAMPAKGGRPDLSEAQIDAAIIYMTKDFHSFEGTKTTAVEAVATDVISKVEDAVDAKAQELVAKVEEVKTGIDGKKIYDTVCFVCHNSGAAGAPKLEATAWTDRMSGGIDALVASAIKGKGAMPPKGGRLDLSDADMKAVVQYMVKGF
jgi:cytochrome c5